MWSSLLLKIKRKKEKKNGKKLHIRIKEFSEIKEFAKDVTSFESDIDICKGSIVYDAKSIMAIIALGSLDNIHVVIKSNNEEEIKKFNEVMTKYKVED